MNRKKCNYFINVEKLYFYFTIKNKPQKMDNTKNKLQKIRRFGAIEHFLS